MFEALAIGATGMQAQQTSIETIAHNLANANTVAFKKGRVGFSDLMLRESVRGVSAEDNTAATPLQRSAAGVAATSVTRMFEAGDLKKTDSPLDIAIRGEGFIEVTLADGSAGYTRGGSLKVNKDGLLATQAGQVLRPSISVPDNAESISIGADGRVLIRIANRATPIDAGQIELVRFANPSQLAIQGDNLYRATEASGEAVVARSGDTGAGTLAQGFVEMSNVKMVDEMVNLMLAQRAYEASVKVVQAADEMLGMANNLRK
ncbi:flagellar basal-body rod protein FlgG [Caenimonas koreensis]|uniref:flagellar basal-body rod protein FlgG n=1 Tax=Caenimonas koreensis TaxID=367474 RepID=UPI0037838D45